MYKKYFKLWFVYFRNLWLNLSIGFSENGALFGECIYVRRHSIRVVEAAEGWTQVVNDDE